MFVIRCTRKYIFTAFTLAEVLITIGIIGIIAKLTIPALYSSFQKQATVTRLQKIYTNLSQTIRRSESDNGPNQLWDLGSTSGGGYTPRQSFDTYWAPYLKILKYCSGSTECGYKSGSILTLSQTGNISVTAPDRVTVMLADGNTLIVRVPGAWIEQIYVDTNGANPPNIFGKDVFTFTLDSKKGLVPYGSGSDCVSGGNGQMCAAKIINDGWQIKDDYPW